MGESFVVAIEYFARRSLFSATALIYSSRNFSYLLSITVLSNSEKSSAYVVSSAPSSACLYALSSSATFLTM
jgi:hypothetical protein